MSDVNNSPIKKQKSESLLNQDFDFQAPAGHTSLSHFSTTTPPATPLRNNSSSSSSALPKSAASEDLFSPSLFGITMTPTTYNFSQIPGMTSSGTFLDSEGNVIYESMPPVPTSRDWTPSMKNLLPTESADFSCFNDAHIMSPPISKRAASLPSNSSTGFHSSEGNHNFIPSSNDSLDNIRFANSHPVLDEESPHGSRVGQISQSHLISNKKALQDRMKGIKQRRPQQQLPDPSSYQRVTRLTSKQQQQSHSSSSSTFPPSYADTEDEPRSPVRRRTHSGIAMQSSSDYNGNSTSTPVAATEAGNVDSPDLIGDTSNLSGFAAITAAAESVEDGGSNGYFKFAESNSSKVTISTSYLPNSSSSSSSSSSSIGNLAGSFSPMQSHRSPTHSPTRSPMYATIINSPLDLLGSVAAHHENFPTEDFPFSQISGDAHSLLIYDHQLSNDSNSRLAYRTYSVDNSNNNNNNNNNNSSSSDNLLNFGVTKKGIEDTDGAVSTLLSAVVVAADASKKDESIVSVRNDSLSSASSTHSMSKNGVPMAAPTPSAPARDPAHVMKTSSLKKTSEAMSKARSDQNLLYLSPEVTVNLDKIGTLDKQSNPELVSCKCKKSRCLKMYCDCFRLQQYCRQCSCLDCANLVGQETLRSASIASIVERNPEAFKPRVAEDNSSKAKNHLTGCRCRRSNCLKKYCECFTGNVICYDRCRCFECKNTNSEIFEIGLRLKTGSSNSGFGNLSRSRIPATTAARSPDDDSLIGSRLEDIKAAADVIDTFKSSTRNEELAPMGKAETRIMGEENSSSTAADRGRKLSFHIASTPAAQSSIPRGRGQGSSQQEMTPMERKFAPEGSMYRDIPTTAASTATTSGSNTRRATPINLDQNMLQNTKNETESKENNKNKSGGGGGHQMSRRKEEHSDDFSLPASLIQCVEDEDKSSAFVKSIKL